MRFVCATLLLALSAAPAFAQTRAPVIVIPGRPDVPVMMNGVDVSWSVIEGEFGLDRPGEITPTVIYRPFASPVPYGYPYGYYGPGYFPATGKRPAYGRLEIVPPRHRPLPPPAPTYYRSWSAESAPGPVTDYAPYPPPDYMVGGYPPPYSRRRPKPKHRIGSGSHSRDQRSGAAGEGAPQGLNYGRK